MLNGLIQIIISFIKQSYLLRNSFPVSIILVLKTYHNLDQNKQKIAIKIYIYASTKTHLGPFVSYLETWCRLPNWPRFTENSNCTAQVAILHFQFKQHC